MEGTIMRYQTVSRTSIAKNAPPFRDGDEFAPRVRRNSPAAVRTVGRREAESATALARHRESHRDREDGIGLLSRNPRERKTGWVSALGATPFRWRSTSGKSAGAPPSGVN